MTDIIKGKDINDVRLVGKRTENFRISDRKGEESYYVSELTVMRNSGTPDRIPVTVTEEQREVLSGWDGYVSVCGRFQSFNRMEGGKRRLILSVFAETAEPAFHQTASFEQNDIYLEGYVCRQTVYRATPLGMRVTDILMAVNRPLGGTDYLPCISWGKYARLAGSFKVGEHIWLKGRIQSRLYNKTQGDGTTEERTAFEVSAAEVGRIAESPVVV